MQLSARWEDFARRPFPEDWPDEDEAGVCLPGTDTFVAGCLATYSSTGKLDREGLKIVSQGRDDLRRVLPLLSGESRVYFSELLALCEAVLQKADVSSSIGE